MNSIIKYSICACFLVFGYGLSSAQLPTDEIQVIKDYEVQLIPSDRINIQPELPENESKMEFTYLLKSKDIQIEYPAPQIKPKSIKAPKLPQAYDGFLKAGVGYPLSLFFDGAYSFAPNDQQTWLVKGFHHSSTKQDLEFQKFSNTALGAQATILSNLSMAVDATADLKLDGYNFFGYDQTDTSNQFEDDQLRHRFTDISAGVKLYNYQQTAANLDYWLGLNGYLFSNNFATKENSIGLDMGLRKYLGDNPLSLNIGTNYVRLKDTVEQDLSQFYIQPTFLWSGQNFKVDLGARVIAAQETFFIYPKVELSYLLANGFSIAAGVKGDLTQNGYRKFSQDNPYLVTHLSELRQSSELDIYGALQANFFALQLNAKAGLKMIDNLPFYIVNQENAFNQFDVGYDTANVVYLDVSAKATVMKGLQMIGGLNANFYDTKQQDKAWYLPRLGANVGAIYSALEGRLELKGDVYFQQAVAFEDLAFGDAPNNLIDLSVGAEYLITENIGVFAQLNNLANNKAVRWYAYPSYGLNILGGISARF